MLSQEKEMMSSLQIAELTGKRHKNLLASIRRMEVAWKNVTGLNFKLSEYKDSTGRSLQCYYLTKTECLYIATRFDDTSRAKLDGTKRYAQSFLISAGCYF